MPTSGKYQFATERESYEDYSGGRVIYGLPGTTGFPVRLASEAFQRCVARLTDKGVMPPYAFYDPCCGAAYAATVLGYLHGDQIRRIHTSDVSREAVELARRNLSLLTPRGLDNRMNELRALIEQFGKQSHREALESGSRLKSKLDRLPHAIKTECFYFDILGDGELPKEVGKVEVVLSDPPYGEITNWQGTTGGINPYQKLLDNLRGVLTPSSVVALTARKRQEVTYAGYRRLKDIKIGKRRMLLLEPLD
jgi:16S rRNA G966 N2-methylase RsmD